MYRLSFRDESRMHGVHHDLVMVVKVAIAKSPLQFFVIEGLRTIERQKSLVNSGASQTMNSRHLTGHAIDLGVMVDSEVRWDWPLYDKIAKSMKDAAKEINVPIVWGGDWKTFKDGPHFELDRKKYP